MGRILPHQVLPRSYPFLKRHAANSFVTYYTYNFADAAFVKTLSIPHGMSGIPLHDMWVAKKASLSGNAVADYSPTLDSVYISPTQLYSGVPTTRSLNDAYYCYTDSTNINIMVWHETATTGTYHVYFHVKIYLDSFRDVIYDGTRSTTS